ARQRSLVLVNKDPTDEHALRHAVDHLVLTAAGLAAGTRAGIVCGADTDARRLAPWTEAEARAHLALLVGELYGAHHAYYLPYAAAKNLLRGKAYKKVGEKPLGFGPIARDPGLAPPDDALEIARRRVGPIEERM